MLLLTVNRLFVRILPKQELVGTAHCWHVYCEFDHKSLAIEMI